MANELIHIGYHKTGTTWLQANLFTQAGFKRYISKDEIRDCIVMPNALDFDIEATRAWYQEMVDDEHVSVISSERLSGHPHSGGFDSKQNADRLAALFPEAKILIVLREPVDAILACYLQYVKTGGTCALEDYINPPSRNISVLPAFDFEYFNYSKLVNYYRKLFKDVLVLNYEDFKKEPQRFSALITAFAGLDKFAELNYDKITNKGLSFFSCFVLRQLNKILSKTRLNPAAWDFNTLQKQLARVLMAIDGIFPQSWHRAYKQALKDLIRQRAEQLLA